jgi:hypothetical protein
MAHHNTMIKAIIMYANDNDDLLPPAGGNGLTGRSWAKLTPPNADFPWTMALWPYFKDLTHLRCPADPAYRKPEIYASDPRSGQAVPTSVTSEAKRMATFFHTNVGYNHVWLSPEQHVRGLPWVMPATQSEVASPANTVLFVDSAWSRDSKGAPIGGGRYIIDAPIRPNRGVLWGKLPATAGGAGGWLCYTMGNGEPSSPYCKTNPQAYGYCYPFHTEQFTVSFLDGHTKGMTADQLVVGIDFKKNKIVDFDQCLWDTQE